MTLTERVARALAVNSGCFPWERIDQQRFLQTARIALAALWAPIETAPKDGTIIDLWTDTGRRLADCRWYEDYDPEFSHWEQRNTDDPAGDLWVHRLENCGTPTHWMLPPVPPT